MASKIKAPSRYLLGTTRGFLALIFVIAGAIKIPHPDQLLSSIQEFQVVNTFWAMFGSYFFPWMELWAGVGLLIPTTRRAAAFIISGLMVLFIIMLLQAWGRGLDLNCGCFGFYPEEGFDDYRLLLLRDLGILVLSGIVFLFPKSDKVNKV